ncbi:hypothetical protein AX14_011367 [Amanita brunnescens Koide BX004]|nr:hypothetical protein AX14_011367 [Amanita brunnescens Koide BX004]
MYCDSTGCSYDAKKNPRVAKYAVTVAEFDDCSYEEYEDTLFLCGQCNMKCIRKVNGSKIKAKMPIEKFLASQQYDEDSFSLDALDLPLPPPKASDFPELPRAAPAPKMTKAEKAMANKINSLLLSDDKLNRNKVSPGSEMASVPLAKPAPSLKAPTTRNVPVKAPLPAKTDIKAPPGNTTPYEPSMPSPPAAKPAPSFEVDARAQTSPDAMPAAPPGIIPIPVAVRADMLMSSPQPSGTSTPIMAMAALHAEHVVSCSHDTGSCGPQRQSACAATRAFTGRVT